MLAEPGLVDTNVLIYALDAGAPQHAASRALLEGAHATSTPLYVTVQILCEFYSIVTNPRRVHQPRTPGEALQALSILRAYVEVLPVPAKAAEILMDLLGRRAVRGGEIFDLQLIAAMKSNGIHRIYTFNRDDFEPFAELDVRTP